MGRREEASLSPPLPLRFKILRENGDVEAAGICGSPIWKGCFLLIKHGYFIDLIVFENFSLILLHILLCDNWSQGWYLSSTSVPWWSQANLNTPGLHDFNDMLLSPHLS